ncbi:MAG: AAA family ATPase, partial [Chlorobi bacterium]|nr:AAA family ATPase [Chlorobiota bacterium]
MIAQKQNYGANGTLHGAASGKAIRHWTLDQLLHISNNGGGTQWIIEGVVPVGHLTWLYGRGESGKSLLALHCCISIAQGATEWLG